MSAPKDRTDAERCADDFKVLGLSDVSRQRLGDQPVLLSQVLAHPVNIGYEMVRNVLLEKLNGERGTSLVHLKRLLEAAEAAAVQGAVVLAGTAAPSPTPEPATELLPSLPPPAGTPHPYVFEFAMGQVIVIDADRASAVRGELCRDYGMSFP
jgi:hypothetical protein